MGKFFRRFLLIAIALIIVLVLGAAVLASVFGDQIGRKLVSEINKSITSELAIEEVDISVITTFPNAAVNLRNIQLKDAFGGVLVEAENASFRFRIFSLLASSIKVKSVVVENGALVIRTDANGRPNYDIFVIEEQAEQPEPAEESSLAISLEEARLNNMELIYTDAQSAQNIIGIIENALFSGEFSTTQFSLESEAELISRFVEYDGMRFLEGKSLSYDATVAVDFEQGLYELERVQLAIEDNQFSADGTIEQQEDYTDFDLLIKNDGGNLQGVLQLLPEEYLAYVGDFTSRGTFFFNALVDGRLDDRQSPAIDVEFGLELVAHELPIR